MGSKNRAMGCGGAEEEKPQTVEQEPEAEPAPEPAPAPAPETDSGVSDGDFEVNVGLRLEHEGESHWFRLEFLVNPKKRVRNVVRMVNHVLKQNSDKPFVGDKQIEGLVPTWTSTWDPLKMDRKLKKSLKHSERAGKNSTCLSM